MLSVFEGAYIPSSYFEFDLGAFLVEVVDSFWDDCGLVVAQDICNEIVNGFVVISVCIPDSARCLTGRRLRSMSM